jgi:hypothetical protein
MNRQPAQVGGGDSVSDWFKEVPLVTKILVTGTVASATLVTFGVLSEFTFLFVFELIYKKFNYWRLFFPFIYCGKFSFPFAMHAYVLYENCRRYEQNPFNTGGGGNSADFLWMILIGMAVLCVVAYYFQLIIMSEPLLYMIMYVWSRRDPDLVLNMYGFKFKALYCPWVYVLIRVVMGGSPTDPLIGIAVGHLYYFLIEVLPHSHGYDLIRTPDFCIQAVRLYSGVSAPSRGGYTASAPAAPAQAAGPNGQGNVPRGGFPNMGAGHQWGRGRALGSD